MTGAGHRLGRAFAVALAERGMRLAVHFNSSADEAEKTALLIAGAGSEAQLFQSDLSQETSAESLIEAVTERMGGLDVLVNSAAVMTRTPIPDATVSQWDFMFALNLRAPFFLSQSASRVMRDGGVIINISDLAAFETWPAFIPHAITKAGIVKMTESLARLFGPRIRVNAIAPGAVLPPEYWDEEKAARFAQETPLGRIGNPSDAVEAMLYLLDATFVTGETIVVDGGRRIRK